MTEPTEFPTRSWAVIALRVVWLVALLLTAYLAWLSVTGTPAVGCGGQAACSEVFNSRWSRWLGLPVSFPALSLFGMMLVASLFAGPRVPSGPRRAAWSLLTLLSAVAAAAAVWFVGLQVLAVQAVCLWCLGVHACALLGFILVWSAGPVSGPGRLMWTLLGATAVVPLILGQSLSPNTQGYELERVVNTHGIAPKRIKFDEDPPQSDADLPLLDGIVIIRRDRHPRQGPARGGPEFAFMYDYTCSHCRSLDQQLNELLATSESTPVVYYLPVPLHPDCNPEVEAVEETHRDACVLAELALAVWHARPQAFGEYHQWLFANEEPRTADEARRQAERLVGESRLNLALEEGRGAELIGQQADLYGFIGAGVTPKLLLPQAILSGVPATADGLRQVLGDDSSP